MAETGMSSLISRISELMSTTSPSKMYRCIIIDAMNMFMRSYHAINHVDVDGDHVGGLAGFLKSVGSMIKQHNPTEVFIVFDGEQASSTKRNLYPAYKGNRELAAISKPLLYSSKAEERAAIYNQAVRGAGYCKLLPVKTLCIDNMEADDVIGYMVKHMENDSSVDEVVLITEDSDYLQLINKKTTVYFPIKKQFVNEKYVLDRYHCHPNNFALYKTLDGDKSDNIPKVKGMGEKTFAKLFPYLKESKKYALSDIFDTCIEKIDEVSAAKKILGYKDQVEINYKLVNLLGIEFLDKDIKTIEDTIASKEVTFEPELFIRLYNADGLLNAIPNVRGWLFECFKPLIKKQ